MDMIERGKTIHERYERQIRLELDHASFQQKPLLEGHFDSVFPRKEFDLDADLPVEEKQKVLADYRAYMRQRKLGINITCMVSLYRRLPLEALVNLFRHENAQDVASTAEALVRSRWILWDADRDEFVTSQLPKDLEQKVFSKRYPMPMTVPPKILVEETDSPYLTEDKSQPVLGEYSDQITNLATLNALNEIPLKLNPAVKAAAPDPFKDDDKFRRDSAEVFQRLGDDTIYLTWQFDFRGRVYARGYHVNPQGDDFHKHTIQFAD